MYVAPVPIRGDQTAQAELDWGQEGASQNPESVPQPSLHRCTRLVSPGRVGVSPEQGRPPRELLGGATGCEPGEGGAPATRPCSPAPTCGSRSLDPGTALTRPDTF